MAENIKFAIVGYGRIGKRHAAIIDGHPDCKLSAVIDNDPRSLQDARETFPRVPAYQSLELFYETQPEIDVLNVCTPNGLHAEMAMKGLEHQHHVVVEKPMALKKADCEKVISQALSASRQVFCVMQNRYSPPSVWLRNVIDQGILGKIFLVEANCYWNRDSRYYHPESWKGTEDLDGGTLFTQFSHFIDIIYWLFGDITNIQGKFANFNHEGLISFEDTGLVQFDFVNGGKGVLNYSTSSWNKNFESTLTILAEHGTIKIGGQYMDRVEYCHVKDYDLPELPPANPPNDYGSYKGSAANHHFVIDNVIRTIKGEDSSTTNALEGLKVVDIIERIYAER